MIHAIEFSSIEAHLAGTRGWIELALVAGCFALAWLADFRFDRRHANDAHLGHDVVRGLFPLVALVLLLIARAAFARSGKTILLDLAIPLAVALTVIRILVYTLRRLFPNASGLARSARTISFSIWGVLVLYYIGVTGEVVSLLESIVIPLGKHSVSLYAIGQGLLVVVATVAVTLWLSGFVERRVMSTRIDINMRVVLAKFLRALLVVVGVLISLPALGIDMTLLSVFGAALGVGIGLGMQKFAANYIAGFTILLDKSIKLGDTITVDGRTGVVSQVTSRYVVVRGLDGIEAIVPNETLVTTTVLNRSHSAGQVRLVIPVRIAYGSDTERALALLEDTARTEPGVIRDGGRAPQALVAGLGDFGIQLELVVWVDDPDGTPVVFRSAIHRRVLTALADSGIEIATPSSKAAWIQAHDIVSKQDHEGERNQ